VTYPCDWGSAEEPHWHVAHCKKSRDFKRARRAERRWRAAIAQPYDGPVYVGEEQDEPELVDEEWDEGEGR
jgi:hypothetical protein